MLNQSFIAKNFLRLCTRQDVFKYVPRNCNVRDFFTDICQKAERKSYQIFIGGNNFQPFEIVKMNGSDVFVCLGLIDTLIIRKIDYNIKRILKIKPANRNRIINDIKLLLEEKYPYVIFKTDIKSMYESINWESSVEKLKSKTQILQSNNYKFLEQIKRVSGIGTLIRGISTSALLAEIYMKDIDNFIRNYDGVHYYARYVDDIMIFFYDNINIDAFKKKIYEKLGDIHLRTNKQKEMIYKLPHKNQYTEYKDKENLQISYLGYSFIININKDNIHPKQILYTNICKAIQNNSQHKRKLKRLKYFSFKKAKEQNIIQNFTYKEVKEIRRCWYYG